VASAQVSENSRRARKSAWLCGICQARCTGWPVLGETNVMRSRKSGAAAMS
jgi:hypothetical protein